MNNQTRTAIVDIGSNSVRLVVYDSPPRAPAILFNEKVVAGLGKGLAATGALEARGVAVALRALTRFKYVAEAMGVPNPRTVATAAVRDASNGLDFIDRAEQLGLRIELLSGEAEARGAGLGVISGIPHADGIVGDLGGGSLELVRVRNGELHERASFPLGVLRLPAIRAKGRGVLERQVRGLLATGAWADVAPGLPFYLVGGSWRALARLHMHLSDWPLPVLHQYVMPPLAPARLVRVLAQIDRKRLRSIAALPSSRLSGLLDAAALLAILVRVLGSSAAVVSSYGLREGLLYADLSPEQKADDPLIAAVRQAGARQARFSEHGDLLDGWIAPLFIDEEAGDARLRHAACLLSDVAWAANPEFRAERGLDVALHGSWVGIDARGRAMMAQALFTSFGGEAPSLVVTALLSPAEQLRATRWGHAMRLGQRLSGGVAVPLEQSRLSCEGLDVVLSFDRGAEALYGEVVERRHRQLASAIGGAARLTEDVTPALQFQSESVADAHS